MQSVRFTSHAMQGGPQGSTQVPLQGPVQGPVHVSHYEALAFARLLVSLSLPLAIEAFEEALLEELQREELKRLVELKRGEVLQNPQDSPDDPLSGISKQKTLEDAFSLIKMASLSNKKK